MSKCYKCKYFYKGVDWELNKEIHQCLMNEGLKSDCKKFESKKTTDSVLFGVLYWLFSIIILHFIFRIWCYL